MNRAKRLYILLGVLAAACIAAFAVLHLEQRFGPAHAPASFQRLQHTRCSGATSTAA